MPTANYPRVTGIYQRLLLSPLGLERENSAALWMMLLLGLVTLGSLWYFEGDVPVVLAVLYLTGVFILTFLRIDYSLYLLLFGVLIFDQYAIPGFSPLTTEVSFFNNLKEISYLPYFDAGMVNPVEIHLFLLIFSLLIISSVKKDFHFRAIPVWIPFTLFAGCLIVSFLYGIRGGGDFLIALWEVRALFYLCIMYLLVPQIIITRRQLDIMIWIFIIAITFKGLQGAGRFVQLGFTTGGIEVLTNHEDPVFMVTLFVLLLSLLVYRVENKQRLWLIIFLIPLLLGFYVAQRRAAYASFIISVAAFILLLPAGMRWNFLKLFLPLLAGIIVYGAIFWNSGSTLGRPVQMIKSGIEKPDPEANYRDYHSNLYRDFENYNLARTVVNNTVTGTGFGKRYEQPMPLVMIRFPLRDYIPHNQILWVLVKMGAVGFFAFWFFFNSFVAKGTLILSRLKDPYLKAVTTVIIIAVINQMVVSYFDLQLTYYRNMLYLGCLMGLLTAVEQINRTGITAGRIPVEKIGKDEPAREVDFEVV